MSTKKSSLIYPTLSVAIEGFLIAKRGQGRSSDTLHDYRNNLNRLINFLGNPTIDQVTTKKINEFFNFLEDFKYSPGRTGNPNTLKNLSPKTIANARTTLSSFFGWVHEEYQIKPPKIPKRSYKEAPIEPFTDDEIERMLKACDYIYVEPKNRQAYKVLRPTRLRDKAIVTLLFDTGMRSGDRLRDKAIVTLLFDTGMRSGELCGIKFTHLGMENFRIFITGKGKKSRYVIFGKVAAKVLWKYIASRFPNTKPPPQEYLFVDNQGIHRMNRDSVRQLIDGIGKRVRIGVIPHSRWLSIGTMEALMHLESERLLFSELSSRMGQPPSQVGSAQQRP